MGSQQRVQRSFSHTLFTTEGKLDSDIVNTVDLRVSQNLD